MISQRYRLKEACFGIESIAGKRHSMYIPEGEVVTVVNGPLDGLRMVEIDWNGRTVLLFTADLRLLGLLVSETERSVPSVP